MSEQVASRCVRIVNPQGLHARPADLFVRTANQFTSRIEVSKDGRRVDGKSILSILTLVAEQGCELALEAQGPDAQEALAALAELVEQGFFEMETDRPGPA